MDCQRAGAGVSRVAHLDVLLVCVLIVFDSGDGLLHLAQNHIQMLVVCLRSTQPHIMRLLGAPPL